MSMPRKLCSRKAHDGLLEISDRVYVFDSCLTLEYDWSKDRHKGYTDRIVGQFRDNVQDASIMICNFREEDANLKTTNNFCKHNVALMDYPGYYNGCPVPKMEVICHFLKLSENWLSRGAHNVLLMHCDHGGGWPVLAFMLAALLIFRKQCKGEEMALDMVYKQAPRELLHLIMPLDPIPSQLRYLQYVSKWNVALNQTPLDRALRLDCIILRYIPNFDGKGVCHPMFRIYGQDPAHADKSSKILYSMPKRAKNVRAYKQGEYELIIVDIDCHVQGDVLIESINLKGDMENEQMMFHAMFNTAFLRSNILMLNWDKVDVLWDAKDHFPKDFRAEILFSEMDVATAVPENGTSWFEEKEGLPVEAFSKAQEIFSDGDWMSPREDPALQQKRASNIMQDKLDISSDLYVESDTFLHHTGPSMTKEKKNKANCFSLSNWEIQSGSSTKQTPDNDLSIKEEKNIKVDATPQQSSCYDSTTFLQQTGPKMPREKKKEENCVMPSNSEAHYVSSTKKTPDNGMSRKEDKGIKVEATPPQPSSSNSTTSSHQTGPTLPREKKKEANSILQSNLEVQSVSSTTQTSGNDMSRKEDTAIKVDATPPWPSCSDSITSFHQTGSKMSQEKKKEANSTLPPNLEVQSVSSTKQTSDNDLRRKEDKTIKDDATPSQPSSSDSTTSSHQTGPTIPREKRKEANSMLPSNLESSTKQTSDNDMSQNEDKVMKVDATPNRGRSSDSTTSFHQTGSKMPQEKKKANSTLPSNLEIQSVPSTKQNSDNYLSRNEDKTIKDDATPSRPSSSDSTTSHQTGPTMPQEKKKEVNSILRSNLEVKSMSSTKQTSDTDLTPKEDKAIKVDATPKRPSSSDFTTSFQETCSKMPQDKKKQANCDLPSNLESKFVPPSNKSPDNDMNGKEYKAIKVDATPPQPSSSDSTTSFHQTGSKMRQDKKEEANCVLPSKLESKFVPSTNKCPDNDLSRKEDKAIKVDATPPQPSSSNSTTSFHQKGSKMPQDKKKEANYVLPSNLENKFVPSTNKTPDNDMSTKEDKAIKVDATPPQSSSFDSTSTMPQHKNKEANCVLPSNLETKSVPSTNKSPDNIMSRKEDKAIKVDATPPQPSSSDSTTSFHQTGSKMPQDKKKEANCVLPSNLETKSMPSTNKSLDNDMSRKEDKAIKVDATPPQPSSSDSTTSFHQTGSKMPQDKKKEANCVLPSKLESKSVPSTKKTPDNDMSSKQDKTIKDDATPSQPSSSDSTTSSQQTSSKMPEEKKKEANCFLPSNSEMQSVSSTKPKPDNDSRRKEDKPIKVDDPSLGLSCSDNICQERPSSFERTSESSNCVTDSKNLYSKQHSSDVSLLGSVDTSSSGSISPQTPPRRPSVTSSAKEVHDYPPHKESVLPMKSRNAVTEETKSNSQDISKSVNFSSTTGIASSCTHQNKSQADAGSHLPASAITSTQPPSPHSPLSSPTSVKNILPVRTRPDSSPSKTQAPPSPHTPPLKDHEPIRARPPPSPPTPSPKDERHANAGPSLSPPPPPPPSCLYGKAECPTIAPPPPPPPPAAPELSSNHPNSTLQNSPNVPAAPAAPPPPTLFSKSGLKSDNGFPLSLSVGADGNNVSGTEGHQSSPKGRTLSHIMSSKNNTKKLKPLHWMKLSRALKGSLWDETQKSDEASKAPEIDMSELENLFSAPVPSKRPAPKSKVQSSVGPKSDKVQLIDHTRAYNCEILLSKVKVPLQDLMSSVLALEESALDTDQVENLMKFCPTKEEIEVLKGYTGEKEKLGRCEQFFLELMKVPRVESKLRVFSFKIEFHSQVSDLRHSLHVVNAASEEIRNSVKLKRIMQTILSLGNALNQGTAKGSAIGFRLDSLLKLTETRSRSNKITLMHYLCKVLADKLPDVLDFSKDLANLEPAAKIQLKFLAEEMQAIRKGLEKIKHELSSSENDGPISQTFCKNSKEFLCSAETEVSSLASLYSVVGGNVDALINYFGEDPSRCPFEQVVTTLLNFTGMFNKANEENHNQLELEMKKTEESATKK